jgi:ABC-type transport system involved in multi-copper enzyme maturation permease subunit
VTELTVIRDEDGNPRDRGRPVGGIPGDRIGGFRRSLRVVSAISWHTFLEAVRDRVLYLLLFFGIFVFGASRLLSPLALGEGRRITLDLGFTAISCFGCLTAIFVGHQLVFREVERKTLYFLFARPLRRAEFVWGKYLGLLLTLGAAVALMGAILAAILLASGYAFGPAFAAALWMGFLELAILAAVAVLLASVTSPVLAGLLTLGVWLIGHGSGDLQLLLRSSDAPAVQAAVGAFSCIVPRLDLYNDILPVLHQEMYPATQLSYGLLYAVCYATAALLGAALVLARRELAL